MHMQQTYWKQATFGWYSSQGSHSNDVRKFQDFSELFRKSWPIVLPLTTFYVVLCSYVVLIRKHSVENVTWNSFCWFIIKSSIQGNWTAKIIRSLTWFIRNTLAKFRTFSAPLYNFMTFKALKNPKSNFRTFQDLWEPWVVLNYFGASE